MSLCTVFTFCHSGTLFFQQRRSTSLTKTMEGMWVTTLQQVYTPWGDTVSLRLVRPRVSLGCIFNEISAGTGINLIDGSALGNTYRSLRLAWFINNCEILFCHKNVVSILSCQGGIRRANTIWRNVQSRYWILYLKYMKAVFLTILALSSYKVLLWQFYLL